MNFENLSKEVRFQFARTCVAHVFPQVQKKFETTENLDERTSTAFNLVQKWLEDPLSVSQQELEKVADDVWDAVWDSS